jgi:hypothetical protein
MAMYADVSLGVETAKSKPMYANVCIPLSVYNDVYRCISMYANVCRMPQHMCMHNMHNTPQHNSLHAHIHTHMHTSVTHSCVHGRPHMHVQTVQVALTLASN